MEKARLSLGGDPHSGVFHEKVDLASAQFVPEGDISFRSEFAGVGEQVDQHLRQPVGLGADDAVGRAEREVEHDARLQAEALGAVDRMDQLIEVDGPVNEVERVGLDLGQVEHVADQLQQQLVVILDDVDELLFLLLVIGGEQQAREPDDGVERRADLVAHVGQERRFQPVGLLGLLPGRDEGLLLFLAFGDQQQRADERRRPAPVVAFDHRGMDFQPVGARLSVLVGDHPELGLDVLELPVQKIAVSLLYVRRIVGMDALEVLGILDNVDQVGRAALRGEVHVPQDTLGLAGDLVALQVPAPRNDVGHAQGDVQFLGKLPQLVGRLAFGRNVDGENVQFLSLLGQVHQELVIRVGLFEVVREGDGEALFQDGLGQVRDVFGGEQFAGSVREGVLPDQIGESLVARVVIDVGDASAGSVAHGRLRIGDRHAFDQFGVRPEKGYLLALEYRVEDGDDDYCRQNDESNDDIPAVLLPECLGLIEKYRSFGASVRRDPVLDELGVIDDGERLGGIGERDLAHGHACQHLRDRMHDGRLGLLRIGEIAAVDAVAQISASQGEDGTLGRRDHPGVARDQHREPVYAGALVEPG